MKKYFKQYSTVFMANYANKEFQKAYMMYFGQR